MDDLRVYTQELETTMRRPDSAGRLKLFELMAMCSFVTLRGGRRAG
jgi:hypothetical protein